MTDDRMPVALFRRNGSRGLQVEHVPERTVLHQPEVPNPAVIRAVQRSSLDTHS